MSEDMKPFYTIKEAAQVCNVWPQAVYKAIDEGRLDVTELFGKKLIGAAALSQFKAQLEGPRSAYKKSDTAIKLPVSMQGAGDWKRKPKEE